MPVPATTETAAAAPPAETPRSVNKAARSVRIPVVLIAVRNSVEARCSVFSRRNRITNGSVITNGAQPRMAYVARHL
jgi:hypothetical protein